MTTESLSIPDLSGLLPDWLPNQRWFGGKGRPVARYRVASAEEMSRDEPTVVVAIVEVTYEPGAGVTPAPEYYQLVLSLRASRSDRLDHVLIGQLGSLWCYDAAHDRDAMSAVLGRLVEASASYSARIRSSCSAVNERRRGRSARGVIRSGARGTGRGSAVAEVNLIKPVPPSAGTEEALPERSTVSAVRRRAARRPPTHDARGRPRGPAPAGEPDADAGPAARQAAGPRPPRSQGQRRLGLPAPAAAPCTRTRSRSASAGRRGSRVTLLRSAARSPVSRRVGVSGGGRHRTAPRAPDGPVPGGRRRGRRAGHPAARRPALLRHPGAGSGHWPAVERR